MSAFELTKEIVVAAIQNGYIPKITTGMAKNAKDAAKENAEMISDFFKTVYKAVEKPKD